MLLATNWISCPVSDHSFNVWSGGTNEQNDKSDGGFAAGSILYRRLFAAWKWYAGSGQWNAERHIDRPFRLEQTSGDCTTKFGHRNVHCSASHGRAAHPGTGHNFNAAGSSHHCSQDSGCSPGAIRYVDESWFSDYSPHD